MKRIALILLFAAAVAPYAFAYDQNTTHRAMTREAILRADGQSGFLSRIGLSATSRFNNATVMEIAAEGARAEDNGLRPKNHFYDPVHEAALVFSNATYGCAPILTGQYTARQWALFASDNAYGLTAAKEHYRLMLTEPSAFLREQRGAALFFALGHIMHLVQDMAQPQHTRNDSHPVSEGSCLEHPETCELSTLNLWSRYEAWCRDNPVIGGGYPAVSLPTYSDYFNATDHKRGMANFANLNFVTEHTNYSDGWCPPFYFESPREQDTTPRDEIHTVTTTTFNSNGSAFLNVTEYHDVVLSYPTFDAYLGVVTNNPNHSFKSYFDYELKQQGATQIYSLPESALQSQASLLEPRAIGYSAGIVARFFRGTVKLTWKKNTDGTFDAKLTNTSSEALANASMNVSYMVSPGTHGAPAGQDLVQIVNTGVPALAPGASTTFPHLTIPGLGTNENFANFIQRVAITGTLGSEPDAVIGLVEHPTVSQSGQGVVTLTFQVTVAEPKDFRMTVMSRYYGNHIDAYVQDGVAYLGGNGAIPGVTPELISGSGGSVTFKITYFRGSHVWDMNVSGDCRELGSKNATVDIWLDDEHYATYTGPIENHTAGFQNCYFELPYFY